jgi:hypothetical protein
MTPEEEGRWLFAIAKHLKVFAQSAQLAFLYATRRSAQEGELLLRIRGFGTITKQKIEALALDIGIPSQELENSLKRLESTGLINILGKLDNEIYDIRETIFTENEVYRATSDIFHKLNPSSSEQAILPIIDLMSKLPLTEEETLERVCGLGFDVENVKKALELQESFGLLKKQPVTDFGITLYYNEYLWGHKFDKIGPVLAKLQRSETSGLLALMEEVRCTQGQSIDRLTSAPQNIIALAEKTGILDTTTIHTLSGDKKTFAFSPLFYGYKTGNPSCMISDPADQIRLFVASMAYGVNYSADFRLKYPIAFVKALLRNNEAGSATPILRDYVLLEKYGIVSVEQRSPGLGTFVLKKRDVVEQALDVIMNGSLLESGDDVGNSRSLISQRIFKSPEENRLNPNLGKQVGDTRRFDNDFMSAVREVAQRGVW